MQDAAVKDRKDEGTRAPLAPVPALDVSHVSHSYGSVDVLHDVSFRVDAGKFCALLGLNGAGKSTLFALVTRLFDRREGDIRVFGFDVRHQSSQALRRMGVVFQSRTLDPDLTVMQNLYYHASLHGLSRREARELGAGELARAHLADKKDALVRNLSGGQQRRVEIVRALLHRPQLILLDEPTVGLDVEARRLILSMVRDLAAERGVGILWATHLIDEVRGEDDVVVLHKGLVLANGTASSIVAKQRAAGLLPAFESLIGQKAAEGLAS